MRSASAEAVASASRTVARVARAEGTGVHTGAPVRLALHPAPAGSGIVFVRTDLPGRPEIPARVESVNRRMLQRMTALGEPPAMVATIEHLLSACAGLGVWDLRVEIDSGECPIFDGSARPFVDLLLGAGLAELDAPPPVLTIREPVVLLRDGAELVAIPAARPQFAFFAELRHAGIPDQQVEFDPAREDYAEAVAPARTFAFFEEIEKLRAAGLVKGGSLDCAIVLKDGAPVNGEYRMDRELARHKLLDLIGDLAVLGGPLNALVTARRTGHALHQEFARLLAEKAERA